MEKDNAGEIEFNKLVASARAELVQAREEELAKRVAAIEAIAKAMAALGVDADTVRQAFGI